MTTTTSSGMFHPRRLRKSMAQVLSICMIFVSGYMLYQAAGVLVNSTSPAVVVLSGSMEPAFQRGDILLLWNNQKYVQSGDIVVYEIQGRPIPIVHRVVHEHHNAARQLLLTKGDNNANNDIGLYEGNQIYLDRKKDITGGVVKGYIPKLGYVTILIAESKPFKIFFLVSMLLLHLMSED